MLNNAQVISVESDGSRATVIPIIKNACINCDNPSCAKRGTPFTVANPKKFPLKAGQTVRLAASARHQGAQAVLALALPLAGSVAGYFLAPKDEKAQTVGILCGFAVMALAVYLASRVKKPALSQITEAL